MIHKVEKGTPHVGVVILVGVMSLFVLEGYAAFCGDLLPTEARSGSELEQRIQELDRLSQVLAQTGSVDGISAIPLDFENFLSGMGIGQATSVLQARAKIQEGGINEKTTERLISAANKEIGRQLARQGKLSFDDLIRNPSYVVPNVVWEIVTPAEGRRFRVAFSEGFVNSAFRWNKKTPVTSAELVDLSGQLLKSMRQGFSTSGHAQRSRIEFFASERLTDRKTHERNLVLIRINTKNPEVPTPVGVYIHKLNAVYWFAVLWTSSRDSSQKNLRALMVHRDGLDNYVETVDQLGIFLVR